MATVSAPPTPTTTPTEALDQPTEHPHVVKAPGNRGGRARIRNSGIAVWHIAYLMQEKLSAEEIAAEYRHLPLSSIYDAMSYCLDHWAEMEAEIEENKTENVLKAANATVDERGFVHFPPLTSDE